MKKILTEFNVQICVSNSKREMLACKKTFTKMSDFLRLVKNSGSLRNIGHYQQLSCKPDVSLSVIHARSKHLLFGNSNHCISVGRDV